MLVSKKVCYVDGHERADVVEDRQRFLRRMVALGFLNADNAPTDEAKLVLPTDLHCPDKSVIDKTVIFFMTNLHLSPMKINQLSGVPREL